ncbi:MAG: flagellar hook-associated protein FlgK [Paracoccaceae bacterium]|nr:flagellar hook-associated protein FlgK [Paracoccaceae bacterium]
MSISNALNSALSGLTANSKLTEITSGNLANALTDSYGRRIVSLAPSVVGGVGNGVAVVGIDRAANPELTSARRLADGELADGQARLDALARLDRSLGAVGDADSLSARVAAFEGALRQLAETPELVPRQGAAASAAQDLATKLNGISTESARVRQVADAEIARQVDTVNDALAKIARINRQVQIFAASGRDTTGLIDQRERLVDTVASIVPIRGYQRAHGVLELTTAEGLTLVDNRARELSFTPSPVITADMRYDGGTGALSGVSIGGVDITPGGPGSQAIAGGSLAGQFTVRDQIGTELSDRADALAADLITRLATPTVDPTLGPGDPGLFTDRGLAFDPINQAGLAGRIAVNALVDPAAGGDPARLRDGLGAAAPGPAANGDLPRAMLDALTTPATTVTVPGLGTQLSLAGAASGLVELTAFDRVAAEGSAAALSSTRVTLATAEAQAIGVDSDAELQALIQIEQAYAANVQVIQAASRMLNELLRV